MKKREIHIYKVIADYPLSCFEVGEEIEVSSKSGMAYICEDVEIGIPGSQEYNFCYKDDVRDYPHLFEFVRVKQDLSK